MPMTDPIADMLTRIRNGIQANKQVVQIPGSNIKRAILERMVDEGYIAGIDSQDDGRQGVLLARLKYDANGESVIDGVQRLSKPGRRVYVGADEIPKSQNGYGTVILSTSRGVLVDRAARKLRVGGEVLCSVW
jgi:small subunit ribosomal protein S8